MTAAWSASAKLTSLGVVLAIARAGAGVAFVVVTGQAVGALPKAVAHGAATSELTTFAFLAAVLFLLQQVLNPIHAAAGEILGRRVDGNLQRQAIEIVGRPIGIRHLEEPRTLNQVRQVQGIGAGFLTPGDAMGATFTTAMMWATTIGQAAVVARFRWWLAGLILLATFYGRRRLVGELLRGATAAGSSTEGLRRADYDRDLALEPPAAKELRLFGLGSWLVERFRSHWWDAMGAVWKDRKRARSSSWRWSLPVGGAQALSFAVIAFAARRGEISLAALVTNLQAASAASLVWATDDDVKRAFGAAGLPALRELRELVIEPSTPAPQQDATGLPRREIRFEGVEFRYPGQQELVLSGVDLVLPAGSSTAIVGVNGAGKTTLVKLLARLYEPTAGRITVDGTDLRDIDPAAWRLRLAAVFQDFVRFELSVTDNVGFGDPSALGNAERLRAAADRAGALGMIDGLPDGWDTPLSRQYAGGVDLSGGEWQRVALARAMLAVGAGAGVLVLDEPTANLDVRAEAALFEVALRQADPLTTLLVSHRFSTVRLADRICVLGDGVVREVGTHDELVAAGGTYAELFTSQAVQLAADA